MEDDTRRTDVPVVWSHDTERWWNHVLSVPGLSAFLPATSGAAVDRGAVVMAEHTECPTCAGVGSSPSEGVGSCPDCGGEGVLPMMATGGKVTGPLPIVGHASEVPS
jgi:hypothetical protein